MAGKRWTSAGTVRHKKAENLTLPECGRKFDVLPKLIGNWEKQYEAGELTVAAGRRAVSPEQAEITRLRAELSRARIPRCQTSCRLGI